jgi:hypothetical protein
MPNILHAQRPGCWAVELEGLQRLVPSPDRGLRDPGTSAMNRRFATSGYECRLRVSMRAQPIQFIKTLSHKVDGSDRLAAIQNSLAGLTIPRDLETQKRATPHHELNRHQTDGHLTRPIAPRRAQVRIAAAEEWQRKAAMCEQSGIRAWIRGLPPR